LKKLVLGFAAAVALGVASFAVPASAATATATPAGISQSTDISAARYVTRRTVVRRGPAYHRGRVCTVRKVVRRGAYGRRVVTTQRVCR
jgi:hypothetical protein